MRYRVVFKGTGSLIAIVKGVAIADNCSYRTHACIPIYGPDKINL